MKVVIQRVTKASVSFDDIKNDISQGVMVLIWYWVEINKKIYNICRKSYWSF